MMNRTKIFFSFSTIDNVIVEQTYDILQKHYNVYKFNRKNSGIFMWEEIGHHLYSADVACFFISTDSTQSSAVAKEISIACSEQLIRKNRALRIILIYLSNHNLIHEEVSNSILNAGSRIEAENLSSNEISKTIFNLIENQQIPLYEKELRIFIDKNNNILTSERTLLFPELWFYIENVANEEDVDILWKMGSTNILSDRFVSKIIRYDENGTNNYYYCILKFEDIIVKNRKIDISMYFHHFKSRLGQQQYKGTMALSYSNSIIKSIDKSYFITLLNQ